MFYFALLQGLHGVFVPLRRGGTARSNDRLHRETLTHSQPNITRHFLTVDTTPSCLTQPSNTER